MYFEYGTSILSKYDLQNNDEEPYSNEYEIVTDSCKNVPFVMNLARSQHICDLEEHKQGKEESELT
jgi:thiamine biosynthesis protein ThiC